jgi:hypothetical protein
MNLFWDTRRLTQEREDHLTCFLAATLEVDAGFRSAYEAVVMKRLPPRETTARIVGIETQPTFREDHCRPDLRLVLADGRVVICEHKLEAPETEYVEDDGQIKLQLERYLSLPVQGVAYFRASFDAAAGAFIAHDRYLYPDSGPHFLWRDLYSALSEGQHDLSRWLLDGFRRLGFTPAVPHVGELWPDDTEEVREHQRNFGKLWDKTRAEASRHWRVTTGRRCELILRPLSASLVSRVYVSPIAQGGSLLRFRAETEAKRLGVVRERLERIAQQLPVEPELAAGTLRNGYPFIDLVTSLHALLGAAASPKDQEERLFGQVAPALDTLRGENVQRSADMRMWRQATGSSSSGLNSVGEDTVLP